MASRRKRQKLSLYGQDVATAASDGEMEQAEGQIQITNLQSHNMLPKSRSLFVHSLPTIVTTQSLTEHFSQSFPLKHATVVLDPNTKESRGYGFVTFVDFEDAQSAKETFDGSLFEGRKIKVELAEPRHREVNGDGQPGDRRSRSAAATSEAKLERDQRKTEYQRPLKLIVRNLPWSIKEPEQLAALFRTYGKIKHATIPKKKPGLSAGFGFVIVRGKKNAEKALQGVNGKMIEGRTLAVDWAVEKEVWQKLQDDDVEQETHDQMTFDGVGPGDFGSVKSENSHGVKLNNVAMSDDELEDDSDNRESQASADEKMEDELTPRRTQNNPSTLFIRNLTFTVTDKVLKEHFDSFGPVRYARVVLDYATERSKGTGFVCFYNEEDAEGCLREAPRHQAVTRHANLPHKATAASSVKQSLLDDISVDQSGRYTLEGRVLQVSQAVDRDEATRLTVASNSLRDVRDRDKRRLYLLSEGTVPSNSPIYEQLAPAEIQLREDSAKQRQTLIKSNPTLHLSLTRLSVRNLPRSITSKDLKALAREAVVGFATDLRLGNRLQLSKEELSRGGDELREAEKARKVKGKGIVKQAKIVFEGREGAKVAEDSGAGRSRGYGFIEYTSHRWALMGLRWLNGHAVGPSPTSEGGKSSRGEGAREKKKRLITEFAIENAQVVGRRYEREAKARERSKLVTEQRERGEVAQAPRKALSRDALMAKTRKGPLRKQAPDTTQRREAITGDRRNLEKISKTQRIIETKRIVRRSRKKVSE